MSALAGTGRLLRLALRRDRVQIPVWALWVFFFVVATASSFDQLYQTAAERAKFASDIATNGAFKALYGPVYAASTGGFTAWRCAGGGVLFTGLMSLLLVVRHTRGDEEAGRSELLGATVVGRYASIAAAMLVVAIANLAIALLAVLGLVGIGLDAGGSTALALGMAANGLVFGAIAAVTAQLASTGRAAGGVAGALLGVAFLLRAAGDAGSGTISWLSPLGWSQAVRAFGGDRWWLLVLPLAAVAVLVPIACPHGRARRRRRRAWAARWGWPGGSSGGPCSAGPAGSWPQGSSPARSPRTSATSSPTTSSSPTRCAGSAGQGAWSTPTWAGSSA